MILAKLVLRANKDDSERALLSRLQSFVLNLESGLRVVGESPVRVIAIGTTSQDHHDLSLWIDAGVAVELKLGRAYAITGKRDFPCSCFRRRKGKRHKLVADLKVTIAGCGLNLNIVTVRV